MPTLRVNGTSFVDTGGDQLQIRFSDVVSGPSTYNLLAYDPAGPNDGSTSANVAVVTWSNTLIEVVITDPAIDTKYLREVVLDDDPMTYSVPFDVVPDEPVPAVEALLVSYDYPSDTLTITSPGGNFRANVTDYLFLHSSETGGSDAYLPLQSPDAGLTFINANTIEFVGARAGGEFSGFLHHIDASNHSFGANPGTLMGRFNGSVDATDPDKAYVDTWSAPANDTVQIDGIRFQTAVDGAVASFTLVTDMGNFSYAVTDPEVTSFTDTQIVVTDIAFDGAAVNTITYNDGNGVRYSNWPLDLFLNPTSPYPVVP